MITPPPLSHGDRDNFHTLLRAASSDDLALVSAIRKADGAPVALICAMNCVQEGGQTFIRPAPLAVMVEGNPYELFEDPTYDPADLEETSQEAGN